jgi:hypothetical protein
MRLVSALTAIFIAAALATPDAQPGPLFTFHSNAWLNLHHYVRAVARGGPGLSGLTAAEQSDWSASVEFYKPYAARDVLRDDGMVAIASALRGAEGRDDLARVLIDTPLKSTLERAMPIYRRHAWPDHDRANRSWITETQPLVARHGQAISGALTRAYSTTWPAAPMHVDLSVVAGPVGAFSVNNHITISSSDPGYRGYAALEMVFHEASHGLELFDALVDPLNRTASEQKVVVPPQLWHAVVFYTAGELTRRELKAHAIDYTPYADTQLYDNMCSAGCRDKIATRWMPYLDGKVSRAQALTELVAAFR